MSKVTSNRRVYLNNPPPTSMWPSRRFYQAMTMGWSVDLEVTGLVCGTFSLWLNDKNERACSIYYVESPKIAKTNFFEVTSSKLFPWLDGVLSFYQAASIILDNGMITRRPEVSPSLTNEQINVLNIGVPVTNTHTVGNVIYLNR